MPTIRAHSQCERIVAGKLGPISQNRTTKRDSSCPAALLVPVVRAPFASRGRLPSKVKPTTQADYPLASENTCITDQQMREFLPSHSG